MPEQGGREGKKGGKKGRREGKEGRRELKRKEVRKGGKHWDAFCTALLVYLEN